MIYYGYLKMPFYSIPGVCNLQIIALSLKKCFVFSQEPSRVYVEQLLNQVVYNLKRKLETKKIHYMYIYFTVDSTDAMF